MAYLEIKKTDRLLGSCRVQGSKNAVLPMLAGTLLFPGKTILIHAPHIKDVEVMLEILSSLGCKIKWTNEQLEIDASTIKDKEISQKLMSKMRSSVLLLAPLLYRTGKTKIIEPGGCAIGKRPIDLHLYVLRKMGAEVNGEEEVMAQTTGFKGAEIMLKIPSVGATEQAILAAVMADGATTIKNAAREPEICELCKMLRGMGANISGDGTSCIAVRGVKMLHESKCEISGDRIVAATCIGAVALCSGTINLSGIVPAHLEGVIQIYEKIGCSIKCYGDEILIAQKEKPKALSYVRTSPYPGFPTDVQSILMSVLAFADGQSVVEESIFDGRFRTAYQLQKMGADIIIEGNRAIICGKRLHGAEVVSSDLRGGAALVAAGLGAEGVTHVCGYEHIARGYEDIAGMLRNIGADVYLHGADDVSAERMVEL